MGHFSKLHTTIIVISFSLVINLLLLTTNANSDNIKCYGFLSDINGNPVNQTMKLFFSIQNPDNIKLWKEEKYIHFNKGNFKTTLGNLKKLQANIFNNKNMLYVDILCDNGQTQSITKKPIPSNKCIKINNVFVPCFNDKKEISCIIERHKYLTDKQMNKLVCHGFFKDLKGSPIDKTMKMFFSIHDINDKVLWERKRFVTIENGILNIELGNQKAISSQFLDKKNVMKVGVLGKDKQIHSIMQSRLITKDFSNSEDSVDQKVSPADRNNTSSNIEKNQKPMVYNNNSGIIIHVPDDYNSIQDAIYASNDGDTIIVKDGTYTLKENEIINFNGKEITVRSENGADACIIKNEDNAEGVSVAFRNGENNNTVLSGFTITDSKQSGIVCNDSSPIISDCIVRSNENGILIKNSSPKISNCIISDNVSHGVECSYTSNVFIENCEINNNREGVYCDNGSSSEITGSIIESNKHRGILSDNSNLTIRDCEINLNLFIGVSYKGGSSSSIINSTINNNKEYGVIASGDSKIKIDDCMFYDNKRSIIGLTNSSLKINNCKIVNNKYNSAKLYITGVECRENASALINNCSLEGHRYAIIVYGAGESEKSTSIIDNCNIINNLTAFYQSSDSASKVKNCTINKNNSTINENDNYGHHSSGINFARGHLTCVNCIITENVGYFGGGILVKSELAKISDCVIMNNKSAIGGGIFSREVDINIENCKISENTSDYGGGVYFEGYSPIVLSKCELYENRSLYGGGIFGYTSSPNLSNCVIQKNHATHYGGGLLNGHLTLTTIDNCTINENTATYGENIFSLSLYTNTIKSKISNNYLSNFNISNSYLNQNDMDFTNKELLKNKCSPDDYPLKKYKNDRLSFLKPKSSLNISKASDATVSKLNIIRPTSLAPIFVGSQGNPQKINIAFEIKDENDTFISGFEKDDFIVTIGGKKAINLFLIEQVNKYVLNIIPPVQEREGVYHLILDILQHPHCESNAIQYADSYQSNIDVLIVLDRSGSMTISEYMEPAKKASCLFVDQMKTGDMLGVVSFSYYTYTNYQLSEISIEDIKLEAKLAIELIPGFGGTGMGAALDTAQKQLIDKASNMHPWHIILLSDGYENHLPYVVDVLPDIQKTKTQISTIALGKDSDEQLLQYVASQTNGQYYFSPDELSLNAIYNSLSNQVSGYQTLFSETELIDEGESDMKKIFIDSSVEEAIFNICWNDSNQNLDLTLKNPVNKTIDASTVNSNIIFTSGLKSKSFTIKYPIPGYWVMNIKSGTKKSKYSQITSTQPIKYIAKVNASTQLSMDIYFNQSTFFKDDKIIINAAIADTKPIIGCLVSAEVMKLSSTENMILYDDGKHEDGSANDGIYANVFENAKETGTYTFNIKSKGTNTLGETFTRLDNISTYVGKPYIELSLPEFAIEGHGVLKDAGKISIPTIASSDIDITLTSSSSIINIPDRITIFEGNSLISFDITISDDIDKTETVEVKALASGWTSGVGEIQIIDQEELFLIVSVLEKANEGSGLLENAGKISIPKPQLSDLTIQLSSSSPTIASVFDMVTIPKGQTSVLFDIIVAEDINNTTNVTIDASLDGWQSISDEITIINSYDKTIYVSIPNYATEGDEILQGTVSIPDVITSELDITLKSSDKKVIEVPSKVSIPSGQNSITFNMIIADSIQSTQWISIEASSYGWNPGKDTIEVRAKQSSTKKLSIDIPKTVDEDVGIVKGYVSIPNALFHDLKINLKSSKTFIVSVPEIITIESGLTSKQFDITILDNRSKNNTYAVNIEAYCDGWVSDSDIIYVKDNDSGKTCFISTSEQNIFSQGVFDYIFLILTVLILIAYISFNVPKKRNPTQAF